MTRRLCAAQLLITFLFLLLHGKANAVADSTALPAALQQQLNDFKNKNDLTAWLYARIDYAEKSPAERTAFLMRTQQEAWRGYQTLPERAAWFNLLILQGYNQLQTGNMLASIHAYEKAMEFYDAYPIADTDEYVEYVLKPLGNNYTRLADYDAAFYIHQKTLQLQLKDSVRLSRAGLYANLATCSRWKGNLPLAASYCKLGLKDCDKNAALYGLLLNNYADILQEQNKPDSAFHFSQLALQQLRTFKTRFNTDPQALYWYAAALQINARLLLHRQEYAASISNAKEAMQLLQQYFPVTHQREKAKLHVLLGDIYQQHQQAPRAMDHYQQAMLLLLPGWKPANAQQLPPDELLYPENTITDALAGKAAALASMQYDDIALEHYFSMFRAARKLREAFAYTSSRVRDMQLLRSRAEAAMDLAWSLHSRSSVSALYKNKLLLVTELSKAQVLQEERSLRWQFRSNASSDVLQNKKRRLQEAIIYYQHEIIEARGKEKEKLSALAEETEYELTLLNKRNNDSSVTASSGLTSADLLQMLTAIPAGTSMLSFFEGRNNSYVIRFNAQGVTDLIRLQGADQLAGSIRSFVKKWYGSGAQPMINAPVVYAAESYHLYNTILGQLKWAPGQQCILLPDGSFGQLPFDALLTEPTESSNAGNWNMFFKKCLLSQAWSLQTWYEQQKANYAQGNFAAWFVAKSSNNQLPELEVEKEQQWLEAQFPGKYYLNEKASWQAFQLNADSASVLHIGTHAVAAQAGNDPYLQLFDQPYYLFDLQYKHFAPALVWLGACRTGDGELMEGEGVNSLSRAFTVAGAGGVVAGMWNVNDKASAEIMEQFYQQVAGGQNAALALHSAKDDYLYRHRKNQLLQLPYYWAGYTYSGHLQSIYMPIKTPAFAWILAMISIMIMIGFFLWFFKKGYQ
ncbi:CHAT domain-containing protein [Pseudoflavitalea sp. G-6-1-2]|uniref:CHAT domain-containing protein n=1 Tax=Pseudoflavitalea sp. G-6-1-2 TaxID=2728841 RepID=UPI00146E8659|nr:CHAT domain-containing protein [Pseudoflavitalea sp. G-6-1-2]NML23473.1 CHAT domain-containing protein [Pseudoflavitalea sp. G-6-1-2]